MGGGISGLSCARKLQDAGKDFLIVTKEVGGRMMASKSFGVDYGAAYITEDYKFLSQYVEKGRKFRLSDFHFFDGEGYGTIWNVRNIRFVPQFLKLLYFVRKLKKHLQRYRLCASHKSVKECFESDPWLLKYWRMPASEFIAHHGLARFDEYIGNPATSSTAFVESMQVNTATYLGMFLWVFGGAWIINFKHTIAKLTRGFEDKIKIASVEKLTRDEDSLFTLETSGEMFRAKNIVIAAPFSSLGSFYNLPKPHLEQPAYTFHVVGRRREEFQNKQAVIFRPKHHDVFMLWKQENGADIVYSKHPEPDLKQYYEIHHVAHRVHWHPGMTIPGSELISQKLENNLYLASDYNLSLLEDSFLTGLYAANQIIQGK